MSKKAASFHKVDFSRSNFFVGFWQFFGMLNFSVNYLSQNNYQCWFLEQGLTCQESVGNQ